MTHSITKRQMQKGKYDRNDKKIVNHEHNA